MSNAKLTPPVYFIAELNERGVFIPNDFVLAAERIAKVPRESEPFVPVFDGKKGDDAQEYASVFGRPDSKLTARYIDTKIKLLNILRSLSNAHTYLGVISLSQPEPKELFRISEVLRDLESET